MMASSWLEPLLRWDRGGFALLNGVATSTPLDLLMQALSGLSSATAVWAWLLLLALLAPRRAAGAASRLARLRALALALAALALIHGLNAAVYKSIKHAAERPRPYLQEPAATLRSTPPPAPALGRDGSFPSGHAANAGMLAVLLAWRWPRWRAGFALLAVAMGLSRVYLGVHYPLDVLAGGLLAAGLTALLLRLPALRRWLAPLDAAAAARPAR